MIDSHCHLDHEPMFSDLKNVILRSKKNGLEKILSICTTRDSFKKIYVLCLSESIYLYCFVFVFSEIIFFYV